MGVLYYVLHEAARLLFFKCIHHMDLSRKLLLKAIAPREGFEHLGNFLNSQVCVCSFFLSPSNGCSHVGAIHKQY